MAYNPKPYQGPVVNPRMQGIKVPQQQPPVPQAPPTQGYSPSQERFTVPQDIQQWRQGTAAIPYQSRPYQGPVGNPRMQGITPLQAIQQGIDRQFTSRGMMQNPGGQYSPYAAQENAVYARQQAIDANFRGMTQNPTTGQYTQPDPWNYQPPWVGQQNPLVSGSWNTPEEAAAADVAANGFGTLRVYQLNNGRWGLKNPHGEPMLYQL